MRAEFETLEGRQLLASGQNAFVSAFGMLAVRGERDEIPIDVDSANLERPGGHVLLGVSVAGTRPGRLDPAAARVVPVGAGGQVRGAMLRPNTAQGRNSLTLVDVGPGSYVALVQAERRTAGAYRVDVNLAGDVDANFRVDEQDLALIRGLQGRRAGRRGDIVDADVDRDGRIGRLDLDLAARNLGAAWRPAAGLTARLDTNDDPNDDLRVLRPDAAIIGRAAPGTTVTIDVGADGTDDLSTTSDASGRYRFDARLAYGTTRILVRAIADSGATETAELTVIRSDVVLDWNEALLDAIRADRTPPPRAARAMAIVHIATYDAVNSVIRGNTPYRFFDPAAAASSAEAAAASAAHQALVALFPARASVFDAALAATLADIPDGPGETEGVMLGRRSAASMLASRRFDGSDETLSYPGGRQPGQWRPTPPDSNTAVLPQWPFVTPFAMAQLDQFRPAGPPPLPDPAYAVDFDEVRRLGRVDSVERTAEQTAIARFWADGAGTSTPPGHWNQIARDVSRQRNTGLYENARTFALLNIALADAGISSWDTKYFYGVWRTITAIREADTDGNPATTADPSWSPLLATPPFPSYTSGHSTFSAAAAEVLSSVFGPRTEFSTTSEDFPDVVRSFGSFAEAADEAGRSRIYGGIHFEFDNRDGLAAGAAVGRYVARTQLV